LSVNLRRDNIVPFLQKIETKLKLKSNTETKLSHFDTWHNCEVTRVKIKNLNIKVKVKLKKN